MGIRSLFHLDKHEEFATIASFQLRAPVFVLRATGYGFQGMFDWSLLASPQFWFSIGWNPLQPTTAIIMAAVFGVFVLAGVLFHVVPSRSPRVDRPLKRAFARGGNVFLGTGALGLFFTFAAYEQAGLFAARFWFLFLFVLFLGWGGWSLWQAHILVPAEREAASIRARLRRYFTKKRK